MNADEIVKYLIDRYNPKALALIGSRANGTERQGSDWDIIAFSDTLPSPTFWYEKLGDAVLDINFEKVTRDDFIIQTEWAPVPNIKILYDPDNLLASIIEATKKAYDKGPERLIKEELETSELRFTRFINKALNAKNPIESTYYTDFIYANMATQLWFQLRGEWPRPIHETLEYIQTNDAAFYGALLDVAENGTESLHNLKRVLFRSNIRDTLKVK